MNKVITISRQYGSGGREIGARLGKALNIPFYDKDIITHAARESGFAEAAFEKAEEKASNSLLYSIAMGMNAYGVQDFGFSSLSIDDRIFLAQSNVIRKFASEGPCVIVGRCADYVLKDQLNVVNVFICAAISNRIARAAKLNNTTLDKAADGVAKYDKRRANYYNYHSSEKWGNVNNYHLSIRSDYGGIDHAVSCIIKFLETERVSEIK